VGIARPVVVGLPILAALIFARAASDCAGFASVLRHD